mmetsp:Transcript_1535/g.5363  ORF Transcript_1535/g.5363 Transcript_1535/m.5363 type:complete len:1045 (-) Transcript_1535:209-3343(-)
MQAQQLNEEAHGPNLCITIPFEIRSDLQKQFGGKNQPPPEEVEITIRVEYSTQAHASTGAIFPAQENDEQMPYMYADGRFGFAQDWLPCFDTMNSWDRCPYRIAITVEKEVMAICSGDLVDKQLTEEGKHMFFYDLVYPVQASEIGVVAGMFKVLADPRTPSTVTHFCLPGRAKELVYTGPDILDRARKFFYSFLGKPLPVGSFKQVFLGYGQGTKTPQCTFGGLGIFAADTLHSERSIDQHYVARRAICSVVASTYFGVCVRPRGPQNAWLVTGISEYLTALCLKDTLGNNWYKLHVVDITKSMCEKLGGTISLAEASQSDLANTSARHRAHLLVYMVEKRGGMDAMQRVLRDIVAEAITLQTRMGIPPPKSDEGYGLLDVASFLKRLRANSGTDVRPLVRDWANSHAVPRFQCGYKYDPRKHQVELVVKQDLSQGGVRRSGMVDGVHPFTGQLTIRIYEIEGVQHDHLVDIRDEMHVLELPCHSRRSKHKSAAQAEKEFKEDPLGSCPVLWVRIDPDFEWAKSMDFRQPHYAWMQALKMERDVVGQYEACQGLTNSAEDIFINALTDTLSNGKLYYRVRTMAAAALATSYVEDDQTAGLNKVLSFFRKRFMYESGAMKQNNFAQITDYFLQRDIVAGVAGVTGKEAMEIAGEFLLSVLNSSDNAGNVYDDDYFVADMLTCTARMCLLLESNDTVDRCYQEILRYLAVSELVPAQNGIVLGAATNALAELAVAKRKLSADGNASFRNEIVDTLLEVISGVASNTPFYEARKGSLRALMRLESGSLGVLKMVLSLVDGLVEGSKPTNPASSSRLRRAALREILRACQNDAQVRLALRANTKAAAEVCRRMMKISALSRDPRLRRLSSLILTFLYGRGVPLALLSPAEYIQERERVRAGVERKVEHQLGETLRKPVGVAIDFKEELEDGAEGDSDSSQGQATVKKTAKATPVKETPIKAAPVKTTKSSRRSPPPVANKANEELEIFPILEEANPEKGMQKGEKRPRSAKRVRSTTQNKAKKQEMLGDTSVKVCRKKGLISRTHVV